MIRRFNYTGRRKLPSEQINLRLHRSGGGMVFDAQIIGLDTLGFPGSAKVFIEAYHQATYMRFDFGTVASIQLPPDRNLSAFYDGSPVNFRIKVVDTSTETGRIIAVADRLHPVRDDDDTRPDPLIPVRLVGGMGQEVWRVIWDATGPVLELNQDYTGIKETLLQKHIFRSLLLPEVLRTVLTRILSDEMDHDEEYGDRAKLWLKFVATFHSETEPQERELAIIDAWVNNAVQSFCRRHRFFDAWKAAQQPQTENIP
jgi:hypothetical protein